MIFDVFYVVMERIVKKNSLKPEKLDILFSVVVINQVYTKNATM